MSEFESEAANKSGLSKGILAVIIGIIIIIVAIAIYLFMGGGSLKQQYFSAEKNTIEEMQDYVEDRYEEELSWLEVSKEKPIKSSLDISAEYNDPNNGLLGGAMDIEEIVNNSTIQILTESDTPNKQFNATLNADVAGISLKDFTFYLTDDTLILDLPFLNDQIKIHDKDIVDTINKIEPGSIPAETEVNFAEIFEGKPQISEEDLDYLKKEYGMLIYNEIPESAFESNVEKTEVNGEEIKAEKITMHLTEEEVKTILTKVFDKLENDKRVKEMVETDYNTLALQEDELTDFTEGMKEIKESIPDLKMPEGLTSSIWENNNIIISREVLVQLDNETKEGFKFIRFNLTGNQIIDAKESSLNYKIEAETEEELSEMNIVGLMSKVDNAYKDDVSLQFISETEDLDMEINYLSDEKSDEEKTDFERTVMLSDNGMELGTLHWNGQANYEKDQMTSSHNLAIEADELSRDLFILNLEVTGEQVKEITQANPEEGKDLGEMSKEDLINYFETDVTTQFSQWMMNQMQTFE